METESEPYVRLASLRQLHQVMADMNTARSLADTLQTVADGVVNALGYEMACVNLVRPDGDLVVAALSGNSAAEALITGRVGSRDAWLRRLNMGEQWGDLVFIPHTEGWVLDDDDVPQWYTDGPAPRFEDEWHPSDRLFAPMYTPGVQGGSSGELLGVISVDRPRNGRRPGAWGREALQMYAFQAAIAISNARLRANMQRALVRLEREQQALRASEESFRQAFEYAPSGMAIAEMGGDQHGRILRTNDALCRLLGRPASAMRRYSFSDLVHPEDIGTLLRTSAEGGRAELRLGRRDGSYVWVSLRNSVVADAADGPRFLLTHVEEIEERKRRELQLAHRASHDSLTGLPNSAELRSRLSARLCRRQAHAGELESLDAAYGHPAFDAPTAHGFDFAPGAEAYDTFDHHVHTVAPEDGHDDGAKGLAVLYLRPGRLQVDQRPVRPQRGRRGPDRGRPAAVPGGARRRHRRPARRRRVRDPRRRPRQGRRPGPGGTPAQRDHPADPRRGPGGPGGRQFRHRLGTLRHDGGRSVEVSRRADVRRETISSQTTSTRRMIRRSAS